MIRLTEIKIKTAEYGQYYKCDKTLVSFPCSLSGMSLGPDPYKTLVSFPCSLSGMSLGPDPYKTLVSFPCSLSGMSLGPDPYRDVMLTLSSTRDHLATAKARVCRAGQMGAGSCRMSSKSSSLSTESCIRGSTSGSL